MTGHISGDNWGNWGSLKDVGVASSSKSVVFFPRPNGRLREDLFTVVTPLNPEGETLDVLTSFSVFRVS